MAALRLLLTALIRLFGLTYSLGANRVCDGDGTWNCLRRARRRSAKGNCDDKKSFDRRDEGCGDFARRNLSSLFAEPGDLYG